MGRPGLPVGQLLGGRVHEDDIALHIGRDHRITNRLQGDLRPFALGLQGTGKRLALGQQFA
ncbi:hypothetical protein D3C76_1867540 [compost metagenome]